MVKLQSVNPSNYQVLGEIEISDQAEIAEKVRLAKLLKRSGKISAWKKELNCYVMPSVNLTQRWGNHFNGIT